MSSSAFEKSDRQLFRVLATKTASYALNNVKPLEDKDDTQGEAVALVLAGTAQTVKGKVPLSPGCLYFIEFEEEEPEDDAPAPQANASAAAAPVSSPPASSMHSSPWSASPVSPHVCVFPDVLTCRPVDLLRKVIDELSLTLTWWVALNLDRGSTKLYFSARDHEETQPDAYQIYMKHSDAVKILPLVLKNKPRRIGAISEFHKLTSSRDARQLLQHIEQLKWLYSSSLDSEKQKQWEGVEQAAILINGICNDVMHRSYLATHSQSTVVEWMRKVQKALPQLLPQTFVLHMQQDIESTHNKQTRALHHGMLEAFKCHLSQVNSMLTSMLQWLKRVDGFMAPAKPPPVHLHSEHLSIFWDRAAERLLLAEEMLVVFFTRWHLLLQHDEVSSAPQKTLLYTAERAVTWWGSLDRKVRLAMMTGQRSVFTDKLVPSDFRVDSHLKTSSGGAAAAAAATGSGGAAAAADEVPDDELPPAAGVQPQSDVDVREEEEDQLVSPAELAAAAPLPALVLDAKHMLPSAHLLINVARFTWAPETVSVGKAGFSLADSLGVTAGDLIYRAFDAFSVEFHALIKNSSAYLTVFRSVITAAPMSGKHAHDPWFILEKILLPCKMTRPFPKGHLDFLIQTRHETCHHVYVRKSQALTVQLVNKVLLCLTDVLSTVAKEFKLTDRLESEANYKALKAWKGDWMLPYLQFRLRQEWLLLLRSMQANEKESASVHPTLQLQAAGKSSGPAFDAWMRFFLNWLKTQPEEQSKLDFLLRRWRLETFPSKPAAAATAAAAHM